MLNSIRDVVACGLLAASVAVGCNGSSDAENELSGNGGADSSESKAASGGGGAGGETATGGSGEVGGETATGGTTGISVNDSYPDFGDSCGDFCDASFCESWSSDECTGSDLGMSCLGTSAGMACSKSCASDLDCEGASQPMACLTTCSGYPELEGTCWAASSASWMAAEMCP